MYDKLYLNVMDKNYKMIITIETIWFSCILFSCTDLLVAKEEEQAKKHILGLKFSQINRIYGDWIDD